MTSQITPEAHRQLQQNSAVLFCGYKVPHPLEPFFELKVQTDGTQTPTQAVQEACRGLLVLLARIKDGFDKELPGARAARLGGSFSAANGTMDYQSYAY